MAKEELILEERLDNTWTEILGYDYNPQLFQRFIGEQQFLFETSFNEQGDYVQIQVHDKPIRGYRREKLEEKNSENPRYRIYVKY